VLSSIALVIPAWNDASPAAMNSANELACVAAGMFFIVVSICCGACAQPGCVLPLLP
jgi:hypothetical protein